jgi:hypothetical protein
VEHGGEFEDGAAAVKRTEGVSVVYRMLLAAIIAICHAVNVFASLSLVWGAVAVDKLSSYSSGPRSFHASGTLADTVGVHPQRSSTVAQRADSGELECDINECKEGISVVYRSSALLATRPTLL